MAQGEVSVSVQGEGARGAVDAAAAPPEPAAPGPEVMTAGRPQQAGNGYYWEQNGPEAEEVTTMQAVGHTAHWAGGQVVGGLEMLGEVVAAFFGLKQSKFQWAFDLAEREREEAEVRRQLRLYRRKLAMEEARRALREQAAEGEQEALTGAATSGDSRAGASGAGAESGEGGQEEGEEEAAV